MTTDDVVEVTYHVTMSDMLRGSTAAARRSWFTQVLGIAVVVVCGAAVILLGDLISIIGVVLGIGLITGWIMAPFVWRMARTRIGPEGLDETMTADDEGIRFHSAISDDRRPWSSIQRADEVGAFLVLDAGKGIIHILPTRAFTPSQRGTFYRLLERRGLLPAGAPR